MTGAATRAAQRLSALAQLWLFASQQQALDCAAEIVGVQAVAQRAHPSCAATATAVHMLRFAHGDLAAKNMAIHRRAADAQV